MMGLPLFDKEGSGIPVESSAELALLGIMVSVSDPQGFNYWISFALVFSSMYC